MGFKDGKPEGFAVGVNVIPPEVGVKVTGDEVGLAVGLDVASAVGLNVGTAVGNPVGLVVG